MRGGSWALEKGDRASALRDTRRRLPSLCPLLMGADEQNVLLSFKEVVYTYICTEADQLGKGGIQ